MVYGERVYSCFFAMIFRSILPCCVQKHARRVYEILRLRNTDMSDEEKAREFRLEVKKRLFGPYRVGPHLCDLKLL